MDDSKLDYLRETFGRMPNKTFENYVCNRLWARIDNTELKPVTQQYVKKYVREDGTGGGHALIDLYFPQIQVGVEVNETYHLRNKEKDKQKKEGVKVSIPNLKCFEIWEAEERDGQIVRLSIEDINQQIDDVAYLIQSKIKRLCRDTGEPLVWDDDAAHARKIEIIRKRGTLSTRDAVRFKTIVSVLNELFDKGFGGFQQGYRRFGDEHSVWFPKVERYSEMWENHFEDNKKRILQRWIGDGQMPDNSLDYLPKVKRAVFAGEKNGLGQWGYTFTGIYHWTGRQNNAEVFERDGEELNIAEWQEADEA
jgi:very-short-patch-repair endonuclease